MRHRIAVAGTAVAMAVGVLAGCGGEDEPEAAPSRTVLVPGRPGEPNRTEVAGPSKAAPPTAAEVGFVQMMIPHHAQALEMSELAPDRASDERVRSLASRIDAAQKVEIRMMRSWLDENPKAVLEAHGRNHGAHTGMPGMATPEQLERLRGARGAAFDELYLKLMITHHQGALTMVDDVLDKGTDIPVQELARDVQSTQAAEIGRMRELLAD
ncbi:lipoprotein [Actinomadura cremea]|nr:lipoprotein [Actinomadura cremea]